MATYIYKAKKNAAETVTGQINAQNQDEAIELISQLGFLPVSVVPKTAQERTVDPGRPQKVKAKELYTFSRQLANLLKSGVSIIRALEISEQQTTNAYLKKVVQCISTDVRNGKSLSDAMAAFPNVFSKLLLTMVHAGEESGNLQEMLTNVAIHQKKQAELASKVRTALAYPCLMAIVGVATVYFVLTFVLPKMAGLFDSLRDNLPLPTVLLLGFSEILKVGGIWLIMALAGGVMWLKWYAQTPKGKLAVGRMLSSLPLFGDIILKAELSRFTRTLELLLKGGVSIISALQISIPMLNIEFIKSHFQYCRTQLMAGGSFGAALQESKTIPPMMGHLIAIAEETGDLNDVLAEIAETYEQETEEKIKIMTTLLEPMMILVIGLVLGFIVFAILLPIFQMDILSR